MQEYKYLKDSLNEFSSSLEFTMDEYLSAFKSMVEMSPEYAKHVRLEILSALSDPNWDWVDEAEDAEFIGADDSANDVWEAVAELIWRVVAPDERIPNINK